MAFKQTPGLIADAFSSAFRQKQQQVQREREFDRTMAEREHQNGLLNYWREQNYNLDKKYKDYLMQPKPENPPKPIKGLLGTKTKNGMVIDEYGYDGVVTDRKYHNIPKGEGTVGSTVESPGDFSKGFGLLGDAWKQYSGARGVQRYAEGSTLKVDDKDIDIGGQYYYADNPDEIFSPQAIKDIKKDRMSSVINESNKLVKQINSQYPGFEALFKNAFQSIKSPKEINSYVASIKTKDGEKLPNQLSSWLKEILNKRIF